MAAKVTMENAVEDEGGRVCSERSGGGGQARERGEGGGGVGVRRTDFMVTGMAGMVGEEEGGDVGYNGAGGEG